MQAGMKWCEAGKMYTYVYMGEEEREKGRETRSGHNERLPALDLEKACECPQCYSSNFTVGFSFSKSRK